MNDDMKKAIEKACRVSALEVSLSGFVVPVETIFKDEYDHRIALLTRAMARLSEQRDHTNRLLAEALNRYQITIFKNEYAEWNKRDDAEIIEILTGGET